MYLLSAVAGSNWSIQIPSDDNTWQSQQKLKVSRSWKCFKKKVKVSGLYKSYFACQNIDGSYTCCQWWLMSGGGRLHRQSEHLLVGGASITWKSLHLITSCHLWLKSQFRPLLLFFIGCCLKQLQVFKLSPLFLYLELAGRGHGSLFCYFLYLDLYLQGANSVFVTVCLNCWVRPRIHSSERQKNVWDEKAQET